MRLPGSYPTMHRVLKVKKLQDCRSSAAWPTKANVSCCLAREKAVVPEKARPRRRPARADRRNLAPHIPLQQTDFVTIDATLVPCLVG
jgi:hypothetical protein